MTEIQLDIIRTFGSKELSEGCLVNFYWDSYRWEEIHTLKYLFSPNWDGFYFNNLSQDVWIWLEYRLHIFEEEELDDQYEILWHIPELFPDVARELSKNWYVLELLKVDTIRSVLKISRYDMKKDILIPYKKLIPLIDQDEQLTLLPLLNLLWQNKKN